MNSHINVYLNDDKSANVIHCMKDNFFQYDAVVD